MDIKDFNFKNKELFYQNKYLLSTQANINSILLKDEMIIMLLDPESLNSDRNITGYELNGTMKWQIIEPDKLHNSNYYTSIFISEDNSLKAFNKEWSRSNNRGSYGGYFA